MKIEKLKISNFKGIRALELDLAGRSATIAGTNGAGKTTVATAWLWLMTGKDSHGRADFEIKPLDTDGQVAAHGVDVSVEAKISVGETRAVLRKVYREIWTKKRGQALRELTGHVVDHFIDGVPTKQGEFQAVLRDLIPDERFRILSSPLYFSSQLPWTRRREILLEVCGDVSDQDIVASDPQLSVLPEILLGRTPDDHRKVLGAHRTETNRELERVPTRIDEVSRNRPAMPTASRESLDAELQTIKDHLVSLQRERAQVEAGGGATERRWELAEVQALIRTAANDWAEQIAEIIRDKRAELTHIDAEEQKTRQEAEAHKRLGAEQRERADRMEGVLAALREKYQQVREAPIAGRPSACPTCGKPYMEAERATLRAAILAEINRDGKVIKAEQEAALAAAKKQEECAEQYDRQAKNLTAQITALKAEIEQIKVRPAPISGALLDRRDELKKALAEPSADQKALARIDAEIAADTEKQIAWRQQIGAMERYDKAGTRIEELKAEERQLAAAMEDIERQLFLLDRFTRAKVEMLDGRINSQFGLARFRMFEVHLNGGITPCCEVLYRGVPFATDLNDAHKVIVGLDIIETLSCHWRVSVPVFIDDAANIVVDLPPVDAQVIKLVARAGDSRDLKLQLEENIN